MREISNFLKRKKDANGKRRKKEKIGRKNEKRRQPPKAAKDARIRGIIKVQLSFISVNWHDLTSSHLCSVRHGCNSQGHTTEPRSSTTEKHKTKERFQY